MSFDSSIPSIQRHWPDADQAPIAAIRVYVNVRARAFKERIAGAIDRACVSDQRAEEAFAKAQALINPEEREDLAELFLHVQANADNLCGGAAGGEFTASEWRELMPDTTAGRRARETALVERSLDAEITPLKADGDVLFSKGYDPRSWAPYIIATAEDHGVPIAKALAVWSMMGPTEAFDGFVTMLGDFEDDE